MDEYKMLYKLFLSALSEDISETEEKPSVNQLQKQTQAFVNQLKLGDKFFIQKSDIRYIMNSLILKNGAIRNTYEAKKKKCARRAWRRSNDDHPKGCLYKKYYTVS